MPHKLLTLLVFCCALVFSQYAAAQDAACDPEYYKSLEARAWMEAQREIEQNQNLIVKPDSVLEYTCFDLFGAELADHAKDMLSETTRWGSIVPAGSMGTALSSLVGDAIVDYQSANFNHTSLGGRGIDKRKMVASISGGAYTCDQMDKIWQKDANTAKCYNFQTISSQDGFFSFKDMEIKTGADETGVDTASRVVRGLPRACAADSRWADKNKEALGKYLGGADGDTPWEEDREFKFIDPSAACDANTPRIKTGVQVFQNNQAAFEEEICLVPGCVFDGGSCS
jgi:hypothetical protein